MRILHAITSIESSQGGPVEGVKQLASQAHLRGHHVEVVSADCPKSKSVSKFPVLVHALGPGSLYYGFTPSLIPWLRTNAPKYDIVIVNGLWQYHSLATWRALRKLRVPYVVFTHGMLDPWFKRTYPLKHLKKWLYWPWGEYQVLKHAAGVMFTSNEECVQARKSFWLYQAKETVVTYGTAGPPEGLESKKSEFFTRFPHLVGKRIAIFLGRIHPKKGCNIALEAFSKATEGKPDWHLVMAGPDQVGWQSSLTKKAQDLNIDNRVTWTGLLEGEIKWQALLGSEILLLPSHQENFGVVVAEALSCGVPVLISNKVNIWREIEADHAGIVSEDDLAGTTHMLETWIALEPERRLEMQESARKTFANRFEITKASDNLLAVLASAVKSANESPKHA